MPNWILKSAIQNAMGCLPQSHRVNAFLQKKTGRYLASQSTFESKLKLCRRHVDYYKKFSRLPKAEFSALELGTGVWPIVPIGLYLCGARAIWTYDLLPLLEVQTLRHTLTQFSDALRTGLLNTLLPDARADRIEVLREILTLQPNESVAATLERLKIHVRVGDARETGLPANSIDLVFSTVVFEHIPAFILTGLLTEFRRVLIADGVMSHYIGLEDQYSTVDRSITPFNNLRFTARQWRWLNNPITSQTRLRIQDYRTIFTQCGFVIGQEDNVLGEPKDLRSVPLAPEFRHHSFEDLLVRLSWLVATSAQK